MGLISTGRANPNDYIVPRGVAYFAVHDPATGKPFAGYRDLGNVVSAAINMEQSDLDHMNNRAALKFVDRNVLIMEKCGLSLTLDEHSADNLALWMSGLANVYTGFNGVAALAGVNGVVDTTPEGGRWYYLVKTIAGPPSASPFDDRIYDIGAVTFVPTAVEGTDYLVDYKMGRVYLVKGGVLDTGFTSVAVAVNAAPDTDYTEVSMFTQAPLRGSLKIVQSNPANNSQLREFEFHRVQLKPTGSLNILGGDDWSTLELTGTAEKNTSQSTRSPVCTVRTFAKAFGAVAD